MSRRSRLESQTIRSRIGFLPVLLLLLSISSRSWTQTMEPRIVSGVVLSDQNAPVSGLKVSVGSGYVKFDALTAEDGSFRLQVPSETFTLSLYGKYLAFEPIAFSAPDRTENLILHVKFKIPAAYEKLTISATSLTPNIDQRNDAIYKNTLFSRDDQIFDTLAAGINAGQHEGGGKSLEIRRFGFNLDHGGVGGGLKVLVDDVQQNQSTQGHGQGYLGSLKSVTPELVDNVDILNGPFSAEYGDFSGLGVVHIRLKETLSDKLTVRVQAGSFNAYRGFIAYSPAIEHADAFVAYEGSRSDGPFINPGRYKRNNVTGNYTWHVSERTRVGFKLNAGANDFYSSGQIPLDLVALGELNRLGYIDPYDGGRVRLGTLGAYYNRDFSDGNLLKIDGFVGRSLFDLYSNFTFFLKHFLPSDPIQGDEIQQHDSRLQEGVNVQYLHPYKLFGQNASFSLGSNFHDNQIDVGLNQTEGRVVRAATTSAHAHVTNIAGYAQQGVDLFHQRFHFDGGLRYDYFRFSVKDYLDASNSGREGTSRFQPKLNLSYTPSIRLPLALNASYGRGISSQDARGVVQRPDAPKVATTDFCQVGTAYNTRRLSLSADIFMINRSNEQVYIPDDGSFEFRGASRSYGWETKSSIQMTRHLSWNAGFTRVSNAFYLGKPRVYVDSAPHAVGNAGLSLSAWHGFNASLRYRYVSSYILDGSDDTVPRAHGLDVVDLSVSKRVRHGIDFNFAIDNLNNKHYWETQNYFESRVSPDSPVLARVHGTPGYPIDFTVGLTVHFGEK